MNTITHNGMTFKVEQEYDRDAGAPWEREDGHGPVSDWTKRDKRAGELLLNSNRDYKRFYDFAGACKVALRDGWGATGDGDGTMTRRQAAAAAAREDYERLRDWCEDRWSYVGVVVTLLDIEGNETDAVFSVWDIESYSGGYLDDVAKELAFDCAHYAAKSLHYDQDDRAVYSSGSRSWVVTNGNEG